MRYSSLCDKGKIRKINQDSIYCSNEPIGSLPNVFIVADGMGGHNAGEFASSISIDYFLEFIKMELEYSNIEEVLKKGIEKVNNMVYNKSLDDERYAGMGTTFVAASVDHKENILYIANVGDSRLYLVTNDLIKVTNDHSLVEEMVKGGDLTEEEAKNHPKKNIITRAVGVEKEVNVDTYKIKLENKCKILLCSDGLTNMLTESEMLNIINESNSLKQTCVQLVETANEHGGYDNISVILIENGEKEGESE